jgi:glycerol-3-phosphate dehydrogenase
MVSVAGGKLTTWRLIGARTARLALGPLGLRAPKRVVPLPGAAPPEELERALAEAQPGVPDDVRAHLARHYGTRAAEVLAAAGGDPALLERIHPDGPDIWAQVAHGRDAEWAATAADAIRGRTTVALRGLDDEAVRARAEAMFR